MQVFAVGYDPEIGFGLAGCLERDLVMNPQARDLLPKETLEREGAEGNSNTFTPSIRESDGT